MKNIIKNFKTKLLDDTKFVHPVKISYNQNGIDKDWEAVKSFDSVSILLYNIDEDAFLLVKQFRPPVYLNNKSILFTYELCAGIVDKDKELNVIAQEEIDEECGFEVPLENIEKITSFYTNVGVSGGKQSLFYAQISNDMQVHSGGGINDEQIETMYLKVDDFKEFIYDESKAKTPGLMFSFMWFMENKYK